MNIDLLSDVQIADSYDKLEDYVDVMRQCMHTAYRIVHEQLNTVFQRAKRRYDVRVRACHFKVGDKVWYYSPRKFSNRSPKWTLQTSGPFEIVRCVNDVNYVIKKTNSRFAFTVHVDRLRRYEAPLAANCEIPPVLTDPTIRMPTSKIVQSSLRDKSSRVRHPPQYLSDFR